jgi:uncharacterized membrane protein
LPAGCTWTINRLPLPPGWTDAAFVRRGDGGSSFVGEGTDPEGLVRPLLWRRGAVTVLDSPGGSEATTLDVNRRGVVLAVSQFDRPRPYLWINGRVVPLAVPAGAQSTIGYAINDAGIIVGSATVAGVTHGIAWSLRAPQRYRDLGVADGALFLNDVTEAGVIVGITQVPDSDTSRALRGTVEKGLSALPGVDPAQNSQASRAAGRYVVGGGQVLGAASDPGGAVLWDGDVATALPPTMGALAVNSKGLVAGYINDDGKYRVATWAAGTTWTLPNLSDFAPLGNSSAGDVMEDGTVVGGSTTAEGRTVPVTWTCG